MDRACPALGRMAGSSGRRGPGSPRALAESIARCVLILERVDAFLQDAKAIGDAFADRIVDAEPRPDLREMLGRFEGSRTYAEERCPKAGISLKDHSEKKAFHVRRPLGDRVRRFKDGTVD